MLNIEPIQDQDYINRPTGLLERKQIIEWVNSIDIPECKQVNSSLSFKNGVLFWLLADYIKGHTNPEFLNSVIHNTDDDNASIYNITLAWREIAEIWEEFNLNPEIVYWDEEEVFKFLKILRDLHFIIQSESLQGRDSNHAAPVELTESANLGNESSGNEDIRTPINNISKEQSKDTDNDPQDVPLQDISISENNKSLSQQNYYPIDNEINDIRELEEELKQNLITSNSNFKNPTFEEPSPNKNTNSSGIYHSNIINSNPNMPWFIPQLTQLNVSNSNPTIHQLASSTTATNIFPNDQNIPKNLPSNTTPKHLKYAISDQISMFSSQDNNLNQNKQHHTQRAVNTSDIVEYIDPSTHRQYTNNADTLSRDTSRPIINPNNKSNVPQFNYSENYHSFNPHLHLWNPNIALQQPENIQVMSEKGDLNVKMEQSDSINPQQQHAFSFDTKNLFKIDDLNKQYIDTNKNNNRSYNMPVKSDWARKVNLKMLPKNDNKKQKEIMRGVKEYDTAKISADSPIRVKKSKKSKFDIWFYAIMCLGNNMSNLENDDISRYNTSILKRGIFWKSDEMINNDQPFIKFIHTSLPFWNITKGIEHCQPLTELEIAWRDQNGDKYSLIDDIFLDNDISDQFIPSPGGKSELPNLGNQTINKEKQTEDLQYNLNTKIERTLSNKDTRNKQINSKHRSLMRPTPIKNYKLLSQKNDDSEDDVISEMRSLNVRPINKENHSYSYTTRQHTTRAKRSIQAQDPEVYI